MSNVKANAFTEYSLTDPEENQGRVLNLYQKMVLQNLRADFAKQKLALKYDPQNPMDFGLLVAELDGKVLLLSQILDDSDTAELTLSSSISRDVNTNV